MTSGPELAKTPENEYLIAPEHFKELVGFKHELLKLQSNEQGAIQLGEADVMELRRQAEALIAADTSEGWPSRGALVVLNGLARGLIDSPENLRRLQERLSMLGIEQDDQDPIQQMISEGLVRARSLYKVLGPVEYNETLFNRVQDLNDTTNELIAKGDAKAVGLRLLGLSAFWSASTDLELSAIIQAQIQAEYVR